MTHPVARVIHDDDAAAEGLRAATSRGALMEPATWLDIEPPGVAENLALDEALLEAAQEGVLTAPVVRTWMPASPAVVMGASSRLSQEVDLEACAAAGALVLRRPSGGLSVVLGPGCLMWSVIWPADEPAPVIDAIHAALLEPLALALGAAGRPVRRRGISDLAMPIGSEERKVSGNALRVRRRARLYHGTLLDTLDLGLIERLLRHPPREPGYRAGRSHAAFVANLGLGRTALDAAVRTAFDVRRTRRDWPVARVEQLVRERYANPAWTARLE